VIYALEESHFPIYILGTQKNVKLRQSPGETGDVFAMNSEKRMKGKKS